MTPTLTIEIASPRLNDATVLKSWLIVRFIDKGADLDLAPQSAGLYAVSLGLSRIFSDDHEMLRHGMVLYDALYAWCQQCQGETHNWPPVM